MTFNYVCDACGKEYTEIRLASEDQWHTKCECGGTYKPAK